jgi:hypothetical protein
MAARIKRGVFRHRAAVAGEGGVSIVLRAALTRLAMLALWSLAIVAATAAIGSHRAERSAYPSAHSGVRP